MKNIKYLPVLGLALFITACGASAEQEEVMTVYKSASCGCCTGWKNHMESSGYKVKVVNLNNRDLAAIKRKYDIPRPLVTCHTAVIGDYFVEGHIPSKVIDMLLAEEPLVDGIAMAGMPSGSPGMPGPKNETWKIYSLTDGKPAAYQEL